MVERFAPALEHLNVQPIACTQAVILYRLEAEADEMWSFVGQKANRQWLWIALEAQTRQIVLHEAEQSHRGHHVFHLPL
jgi:insertion element IS1 protein InsB